MPFWWKRRNKWWSTWRYRYRRNRNRFRKPRRRIYRRRHRRAPRRRRRRRRTKVRRKRKFLKLKQWQPDSIRRCKIKGLETIVLGANGRQFRNYTFTMNDWNPPTTPGGGGFSTAKYSLSYLFEQFTLGNNIWTTSNCNFDLCRYTGAKFIFYRHPDIDFIVQYQLEYPLTIQPDTYYSVHPHSLLLQKHTIIIPSLKHKPFGKTYIKKKIPPPKQMVNKWFFQHGFADTGLLLLKAAAADLLYSHIGQQGENELTSFFALNTDRWYMHGGWGIFPQTTGYFPVNTWGPTKAVTYTLKNGTKTTYNITKDNCVSYTQGWFSNQFLTAKSYDPPLPQYTPYVKVRYNPKIDTGKDNLVYFLAVQQDRFTPPTTDKILIMKDKPLWLLCFGWPDYILKLREKSDFMRTHYIVFISRALYVSGRETALQPVIPIDDSFINGRGPYNYDPTTWQMTNWFPTFAHQQQSINNIVKCGPFIPKLEGKKTNWELHAKYCFFFKWGGSTQTNNQVCDPTKASEYPGPNPIDPTIQISNPESQIPQSLLHIWDWRRGYLTKKALKRMSDNIQIESTLSTDSEYQEPQLKKFKTKKEPDLQEKETKEEIYLQQLFAGDTFPQIQEETDQQILQLIQQQQHQQQQIKLNLVNLLTSLKQTQVQMQLQTGIL
nr:MAG: ORF1 [Torque teno midi virus]